MAAIIIPSRRWRQPGWDLWADWNHPITRNLIAIYSPARTGLMNLGDPAGYGPATLAGGTLPNLSDGGKGIIGGIAPSGSIVWLPSSLATPISATSEVTLVAICGGFTKGTLTSIWQQGTTQIEYYPYADQTIYLSSFIGTRFVSNVAPKIPDGTPHILAVQVKNLKQRASQNNITLATATINQFPALHTSSCPIGTSLAGDSAPSYPVAAFMLWNRYLGDSEIGELAENPWQMFKQRSRRIYSGIAAGAPSAFPTYYYAQQRVQAH